MEINRETFLTILYIFLSATIVFLPLASIIPGWMNLIPFYRRAVQAINNIFESPGEVDLLLPRQTEKQKVLASIIKKGDRGFKEILSAIRAHQPMINKEITSLGLVYSDIKNLITENSTGLLISPNYLFFVQSHDKRIEQIMFNPMESGPTWIKENLVDWVKVTTQKWIAITTAIVAVVWVTIMTLVIYS